MFNRLLRRLDYLLHRRRREAELAEEMAFHQQLAARSGGDARFGNATLAREDARGVWLAPWVESVWQDLRHGVRLMLRSPVTTLVAVLTLALGIGANTAVYSLIDAAMLRPLDVREPERLVFFVQASRFGLSNQTVTTDEYVALRDHNRTLSGIAAYDNSRVSATIGGEPEMLTADFVTANYFDVLGLPITIGRSFEPSDDAAEAAQVVILSEPFWRRRFASDRGVLGRTMLIGGVPSTIVGISPASYHGRRPAEPPADVTLPLAVHAQLGLRDHTSFELMARLRPGVTIQQAAADLEPIHRQARRADPAADPGVDISRLGVLPGARGEHAGTLGPSDTRQVITVSAIVAALLLIVCVNVATLLFARASARRREMAVRLSIGAGPRRLLRQLLTESLLVALTGGAAALLVSQMAAGVLTAVLPLPQLTRTAAADPHALLFTLLVSALAGLAVGMAPSLSALKVDVAPALKAADGESIRGTARRLAAGSLIVAQVALSLALLTAAGLLVHSLENLYRVDTRLDAGHVLTAWAYPSLLRYDHARELVLYRRLLDRLQDTPGIRSATLARYSVDRGTLNFAAPGLFTALGLSLTQGRDLTVLDVTGVSHAAVISETAAKEFFPGESAIGREVPSRFARNLAPLTIVGVAPDITMSYRPSPPHPAVYVPYTLASPAQLGQAILFVKTQDDAAARTSDVRRAVQSVEPDLVLLGLKPLSLDLDRTVDPQRSTAALIAVCGGLALALVAIGLYGTLANAVARRRRELGIRISLGAPRSEVVRMILRESMATVAAGVALGIVLSFAAARGLSALLFGVGAVDPLALAPVIALVFVVALAAAYVPARRAARVDPVIALRQE